MTSVTRALASQDLGAGRHGDAGLFGPDSIVWRIGRERVLLAGGPAALLLQVAHPLVAAAVAGHSRFETDPLRRLRATLTATLTVTFGDVDQANTVAAALRRRHQAITGRLIQPVGRFPAGTPYAATDGRLLLWVHATLVYTGLEVFDRFVHPLREEQRARYYAEMKPYAQAFGVPEVLLPRDYREFKGYFAQTVHDDLAVGPAARSLAPKILDLGFPASPVIRRLRDTLTAGLLPVELRAGYRLRWGTAEATTFAAVQHAGPPLLALLPHGVRFWPQYRTARRRTAPNAIRPAPPSRPGGQAGRRPLPARLEDRRQSRSSWS